MKNKPIRVSDVVDMPENREVGTHCFDNESEIGNRNYNEALNQISTLEVSPDKLREMGWVRKTEVELDTYEIALLARRILELDCDCDPKLGNDFVVCENCLSLRRFKEELANKTQDIIK